MNALYLLVLASSAAAIVDAPIDRVTVFSDRAEVTRQAPFACQGSETVTLAFPILPSGLDARTLRAEASAPARTIGVTARMKTIEAPLNPEVAAIRQELQEIGDVRVVLDHRQRSVEERHQAAEAYSAYLQGVLREAARAENAQLERWTQALDLLQQERTRAGNERLEIAAERRELDRRTNLLNRRLAARAEVMGGPPDQRGHEVSVTVECKGARRGTVNLSYVVPGATWAPEYDLRFDSTGGDGVGPGQALIEIGAVVRQATGESWNDATVVLTTARPRLGAQAPQPAPIYVDGQEVGKQRMLVEEVEDRRGLPQSGAAAPTPPPSQAQLDDGGRAFNLTIPTKVSVRSDARPYRFPIDSVAAEANGRRIVVPKLSFYVYRVALLDNPASFPLLEGPMHVFRDGNYAGRITLEYTAPGAPMELSMGPDETVRVMRHDISETDRSPGFLQRTRTMERAYRIELENGNTGPVTVFVRENIPVSGVDDVRVSLLQDKTTQGYELDEERGILTWTVELARGAKANVDIGFTVRLPEHWELAAAN